MSEETSTFRLYLMRFAYLGNFVLLGLNVWPVIINHKGAWDPMHGVAFSFWAALSALAGLGVRYPLKMLPLLLLQLLYKSIWLIAVYLMVDSSLSAVEVCRPINGPYQGHGYGSCYGSDCYSLAVCSGNLREAAWR